MMMLRFGCLTCFPRSNSVLYANRISRYPTSWKVSFTTKTTGSVCQDNEINGVAATIRQLEERDPQNRMVKKLVKTIQEIENEQDCVAGHSEYPRVMRDIQASIRRSQSRMRLDSIQPAVDFVPSTILNMSPLSLMLSVGVNYCNAWILFEFGRYNMAIRMLSHCFTGHKDGDLHVGEHIMECYLKQGNTKEALKMMDFLVTNHPDNLHLIRKTLSSNPNYNCLRNEPEAARILHTTLGPEP